MSQLIYNSHNQLQFDATLSKQISHTILVEIPFYKTWRRFTNIIINLFCFNKPTNIIFIPYSNDSEIQWIKMIKVNSIFNLISIFESLCILLNTELMLPQVTKSLLDLEDLVKGHLKI